MSYIDGFVSAVPNENKEKYLAHAKEAALLFKEHGAIKIVDCWGDDVPEGKITSFPLAVKCKPNETVVFSWVYWPSKEIRDQGVKKILSDPRMDPDITPLPYDGMRMLCGGFEVILDE